MTSKEEVKYLKGKLYHLKKTYRRQVRDLTRLLTIERQAHKLTLLAKVGITVYRQSADLHSVSVNTEGLNGKGITAVAETSRNGAEAGAAVSLSH